MRVLAIAALTAMMAAPCHAIVGGTATTAFQAVGVGVQVTPDWVVTAWHIAPGVGSSYSNGYGSRTVLARYDAPGSGAFPANDLTLLRLTPTKAVVPSLAVAGNTFASGSVTPLDVTITSPSNSGPARGYGFTTVSQFAKQSGLVTVNYLISLDASVYVQGGDSGGGLFAGHVLDSTTALLGINSAQLKNASNQPVGSGFVLLAEYRPWIDQTMAAAPGNTQMLNWVSAVPEPMTITMFLVGGGMLAWRRTRAAT